MDIGDGKRAGSFGLELATRRRDEENLIVDTVVTEPAAKIGAAVVGVDDDLATIADEIPVGEERDVEEHVAIEDEGTGRHIEGLVGGGAACTDSSGKAGIDEVECIFDVVGGRTERNVEHILHCLVQTFDDCVGLRVTHRGGNRLNVVLMEHVLEGTTGELSTLVVKATERTGVAREPHIGELHGSVLRGLVVDADAVG